MLLEVRRPHVSSMVGGIHLNLALQPPGVLERSHDLAKLLLKDESGLGIDVHVAAQMQRRLSIDAIDPEFDPEKDVAMSELTTVEDRSGGRGNLLRAFDTFVYALRSGDLARSAVFDLAIELIGYRTFAARAEGLAAGLCVAGSNERIDRSSSDIRATRLRSSVLALAEVRICCDSFSNALIFAPDLMDESEFAK